SISVTSRRVVPDRMAPLELSATLMAPRTAAMPLASALMRGPAGGWRSVPFAWRAAQLGRSGSGDGGGPGRHDLRGPRRVELLEVLAHHAVGRELLDAGGHAGAHHLCPSIAIGPRRQHLVLQ